MATQPECTQCGDYVNHGPVVCNDCSQKQTAENARLRAELETARELLQEAIGGEVETMSLDGKIIEFLEKEHLATCED